MTAVDRRIDMNKKRPSPPWIKIVLLFAVIFGISIRSCWYNKQGEQVIISDAQIQDFTSASIDVIFTVENKTSMQLEKNVLIRVTTESGEEIASRITSITLLPSSKKKHLKVLQKLSRPIRDEADVKNVTVELYIPTILN